MAPVNEGQPGDDDFGAMFDVLDLSNRGYLTAEEIGTFYQSLFYKSAHDLLLNAVLRNHGGASNGLGCVKVQFENVLIKLEEGRKREESLYWDFIALDEDGYQMISVKQSLLLARSAQPDFSLKKWKAWVNSRSEPFSNISWTEFQQYLYSPDHAPQEITDDDDAVDEEFVTVAKNEQNAMIEKYEEMKGMLENDEEYASRMKYHQEAYHEQVKTETNRLVNRWSFGGAEAVIYDDGTEMKRPTITTELKNVVSVGDLLSALDVKYSMLRHIILTEMAKSKSERESPGMAVGGQVVEKHLHDMKRSEKDMRRLKRLDQLLTLPGSEMQHSYTSLGVMGETADAYVEKWEKAEKRFGEMRAQGRTTDDINRIYEKEIVGEMNGITTNGELLIHLAKREEEEKAYMLKLLKATSADKLEKERMRLYASLHLQCIRIEKFGTFEHAAMSGCLVERNQMEDFDKYSPDHTRQEKLSKVYIAEGVSHSLGNTVPGVSRPDVSHSKNLGLVDSWLEITRLLSQKHSAEREVMTHFLLSNKLQADLIRIKNDTQKELQALKRDLVKQKENWKESSFQKSTAAEKLHLRSRLHEILSTGVALYWENLTRSKDFPTERIRETMLARLQVLQDIESQRMFERLEPMNAAEIYNLRKEIYRVIRDEHLDNITSLVLASDKITAEEQRLVDLILSKYDQLRLKLFEGYVHQKNIPDDGDRAKLLEKLRFGEEKSRLAGSHGKLAKLCKETFGIRYSLQDVMGPDTSRFDEEAREYLAELKNSGRSRKLINEPPNLGNDPDQTKARGNLLSELHLRYEDEVDLVLRKIREAYPAEKSFLVAAESAWQQWEILRSNLDGDFSKAAIAMGLCERMKIGEGKIKLRQDSLRYVQLAQERLMTSTTLDTKSLQGLGSSANPVQSSLRRVLLCHAADWKKLYGLLSDKSAEELRVAAASMTEDERSSRLAEIDVKRSQIDTKAEDWQGDVLALLEEAAAIKYVTRMGSLKKVQGDSQEVDINDNDIYTTIMADLQEEHDKDGFRWFNMALEDPASAPEIKDRAMDEGKVSRNIFNVLCKYEGQADDDEILQALEDKYDSLRDKLLAEALMKLLGEKAWKELSERERQERLMKLKLEERRLRREGKYDELAKLLGDASDNEERLRNLMGMSREEYERKLQERLKLRKQGIVGLAELDMEGEESETGDGDPLTDLTSRYEQEKEALLRMLAGKDARYLSEQERQRELARLRRELRKSEREEKFGAAAMVLGLAERNAEREKRLESDRKRQEELAKQRIAALKAKMKKGHLPEPSLSDEDEKIIKSGTKTELMDAVLAKQELLFAAERAWLVHILNSQSELKQDQTGVKQNDPAKLSAIRSSRAIWEKLDEIYRKLPNQVNVHESRMPLIEGSFFRQAILSQELVSVSPKDSQSKDCLDIKTVAILQEIQDRKSQMLTDEMSSLSEDNLIELQESYLNWVKIGVTENIPTTLFAVSHEDDALENALQGKYDAILTALVAKNLLQKKGEKKWNSMTEPERERLIAETTHEIKKLIAEGKTDQASKLLGELGEDSDAVRAMFGIASEEEERKRLEEERKGRKRERIEEGMSEEEADKLMGEEEQNDEDSLKKRRKNVLELLQYDLEAQKAALLKRLAETDERLSQERKRQLELARLRLAQRMMQRENNVQAVAQILALSKLADEGLEREKMRQLELARKRLEAHRNGRGDKQSKVLPLKLPDNPNELIELIIKELEMKQTEERSVLMQLLMECAAGSEIQKKISEMDVKSLKTRVGKLYDLRKQWRNGDLGNVADNSQEQMTILREATAVNLQLLLLGKEVSTESDGQEEILAKLQKQQLIESSNLINDLPKKNTEALQAIAKTLWRSRNEKWFDNVAQILLQSDLSDEEEEIVDALEKKYDALKDKLIAAALMKQFGEKEWRELSEKDRQREIMEMKLQERKLRQEGKLDEAAALMSSLIKSEEDIARVLGETKLSQQEELQKRLERRRQLREERLAAGLAVDEPTLDKEMDKIDEEEKQKRKNVLLLLEQDLDKERNAVLARLRRQDEAITSERKRQLEMARLRRERKLIAREDQFHAAAIIFNQAKRRDDALAQNMSEAQSRQLTLAQQRVAAMKKRKQDKEAAAKLFDVSAVTQRLEALESEELDQSLSSPERLLQQMDAKQLYEREELLLLLLAVEMDPSLTKEMSTLSDEQNLAEQDKLIRERKDWREQRFVDHYRGKEEPDEARRGRLRKLLAESIVQQNRNMKRFVALKIEDARRKETDSSTDFMAQKNEATVKWLADVQTFQTSTAEAVNSLIAEKSDEILDMMTYGERKGRIESWNDSIVKVLMGALPPGQATEPMERQASSVSTGSSYVRTMEETQKQIESLDQELEEQKQELEKQKAQNEDVDVDAALTQLQKENDAKRTALSSELERQRKNMEERIRMRREKKEQIEYEAHAAAAMVILAERRVQDQKNQQQANKSRQKTLMEKTLEERRKRRQEAKRLADEQEANKSLLLPPGGGLKREQTVLDIKISEDEKRRVFDEMQETSLNMQKKMQEHQNRQRIKLQEAIADKKRNRRDQVDKIIREQTIVIEKRELDLKRQKTVLEERLQDIRTGKTKAMKEKGDKKVRDFEMLVNTDAEGMSKDEKMKLAAENLQKKLIQQKETEVQSVSPGTSENFLSPRSSRADDELSPRLSSRRGSMITDDDRVNIMKRRASLKKKRVQEEEGRLSPRPDAE